MKPWAVALIVVAIAALLWWASQVGNKVQKRNVDLADRTKEPEPLGGMVKVPA
jgi:hypothetical protein